MVECWRCTYPSTHFFVSRSRSVVWQAHIQAFTLKLPQDHGRLSIVRISEHSLFSWRSVVLCVVLVVCVCCCVVVVRVCVVYDEAWHSLSLLFSLLPLLFPFLFLSYRSFSLFFFFFFFSLLLLLLLLLLLFFLFLFFLLSSLLLTLLFSPPSSLPPTPRKKRGNQFQKIAAGWNYRRYSFILIPKQ